MRLTIARRKPCVVCGVYFTKPPDVSMRNWPARKCCSWDCSKEVRRRPNPKVSKALKGRRQPPELVAKRSEGLKKAHAEGRMGDYSHLKELSGPQTSQWKGDDIQYRAMHSRIVQVRGRAADHDCVDCGGDAREWSYREPEGFSTNIWDYSPRCLPCHRAHDGYELSPRGWVKKYP